MSKALLNRVAPFRDWSKTGVNIFTSDDGKVEAAIVYTSSGQMRHPTVTLRWKEAAMEVVAYIYAIQDGVEYWEATMGNSEAYTDTLPALPDGSAECVFTIIALLGMQA